MKPTASLASAFLFLTLTNLFISSDALIGVFVVTGRTYCKLSLPLYFVHVSQQQSKRIGLFEESMRYETTEKTVSCTRKPTRKSSTRKNIVLPCVHAFVLGALAFFDDVHLIRANERRLLHAPVFVFRLAREVPAAFSAGDSQVERARYDFESIRLGLDALRYLVTEFLRRELPMDSELAFAHRATGKRDSTLRRDFRLG